MKKKYLIIFSVTLLLTACGKTANSDTTSAITNSSLDSVSSISSEDDNTPSSSSISQSISSTYDGPYAISSDEAINLISYAGSKDVLAAISSTMNCSYKGFDNGTRYTQNISQQATSYKDNLTIAYGTVTDERNGRTLSDDYTQVKTINNFIYFNVKEYKYNIFQSETEKVNISTIAPENQAQAYSQYEEEASCGSGYNALDDFIYAYQLGASFYYSSHYENGRLMVDFSAQAENEQSNIKYIATFHYQFDSEESGRLENYVAEQAFYSLDRFNASEDTSTLEPTYYAKEEDNVTFGTLTEYTGELPISLADSFVQSVELSAAKNTITVDEVIALKAIVLPETAEEKSLFFASENESIARVDSSGRVVGVNPGKCKITATNVSSGVVGEFEITVIAKNQIDPGDDSKKGDLKIALASAKNQIFSFVSVAIPDFMKVEYSIAGMCMDSSELMYADGISSLCISSFAYDENLRKATYVGSDVSTVLNDVLPFVDNGNDNVTNNYFLRDSSIYRDTILSFELYLGYDNSIEYIHLTARTDYANKGTLDFSKATTAQIESNLSFEAGYTRDLVFETEGYVEVNEEE